MNEIDRIKRAVASFEDFIIRAATGTTVDVRDYIAERDNVLSERSIVNYIPEFVFSCRTLKTYWPFIKAQSGSYQGRREFIKKKMEPLHRYLANDSFEPKALEIQAVLSELNVPAITNMWKKAEERKNDDLAGAVTAARSLLEAVCKYILDVRGIKYSKTDNMPKLYNKVAQALNIDESSNQVFQQIYGGCKSVVIGVGKLRNEFGDAHGKGSQDEKIDEKTASLAIGLAGSMTIFLAKAHLEKSR